MQDILERYFPVADLIAATFGKNCEVVVHDLRRPENSVVYVANGSVTGRTPGQSFDHLVKQVLLSKNFKKDARANYFFETEDKEKIKSSSLLIRDEEHTVIGMLCINVNVTVSFKMLESLQSFLDTEDKEEVVEEPPTDVLSIIDDLILKIIGQQDVKNLTRKKCVEIIGFMEEKGVFLVKGSVDKVAEIMGVTKVTVYSYLDEAKGKKR